MESEKVKEIKKALEFCAESRCKDCPYGKGESVCLDYMSQNALTLINELESEKDNLYNLNQNLISDKQVLMQENERLTTENVNYYGAREQTIEDLAEIINKQKDRIAELEKQMCRNEDLHNATEKLNDIIILKQFAERLKEKFRDYETLTYKNNEVTYHNLELDIDEALKEFVGVEE